MNFRVAILLMISTQMVCSKVFLSVISSISSLLQSCFGSSCFLGGLLRVHLDLKIGEPPRVPIGVHTSVPSSVPSSVPGSVPLGLEEDVVIGAHIGVPSDLELGVLSSVNIGRQANLKSASFSVFFCVTVIRLDHSFMLITCSTIHMGKVSF